MSDFCGITSGILNNCDTLKAAIGGLKKRFWVGVIDELDTTQTLANVDGSGNIVSLSFLTYGNLYKFVGIKDGNSGSDDVQRDDDGNPFFPHQFTFKIYDETAADTNAIYDLSFADVYCIYETATGDFEIVGLPLGLSITSATRATGNTPGDSTVRLVTLDGNQTLLRQRFSAGTRAETIAALESYEA